MGTGKMKDFENCCLEKYKTDIIKVAPIGEHYQLSSKKHSNIFFDFSCLLRDVKISDRMVGLLCEEIRELLKEKEKKIDVVLSNGSSPDSGTLGFAIAEKFNVRSIYKVFSRQKGYILKPEFLLFKGENVLIVDSCCLSGAALKRLENIVLFNKATVVAKVAIMVNKSHPGVPKDLIYILDEDKFLKKTGYGGKRWIRGVDKCKCRVDKKFKLKLTKTKILFDIELYENELVEIERIAFQEKTSEKDWKRLWSTLTSKEKPLHVRKMALEVLFYLIKKSENNAQIEDAKNKLKGIILSAEAKNYDFLYPISYWFAKKYEGEAKEILQKELSNEVLRGFFKHIYKNKEEIKEDCYKKSFYFQAGESKIEDIDTLSLDNLLEVSGVRKVGHFIMNRDNHSKEFVSVCKFSSYPFFVKAIAKKFTEDIIKEIKSHKIDCIIGIGLLTFPSEFIFVKQVFSNIQKSMKKSPQLVTMDITGGKLIFTPEPEGKNFLLIVYTLAGGSFIERISDELDSVIENKDFKVFLACVFKEKRSRLQSNIIQLDVYKEIDLKMMRLRQENFGGVRLPICDECRFPTLHTDRPTLMGVDLTSPWRENLGVEETL